MPYAFLIKKLVWAIQTTNAFPVNNLQGLTLNNRYPNREEPEN
jgi:hypothetical protein